jgi:hypothetical protein
MSVGGGEVNNSRRSETAGWVGSEAKAKVSALEAADQWAGRFSSLAKSARGQGRPGTPTVGALPAFRKSKAEAARDEAIWRNATSKQRGELAEMMFMVKAAQKGFATAKPYGDSRRYDFVVDTGRKLWKTQVKSSSALQYGSYQVNLQRNANGEVVCYEPWEVDFVVAYVFPCEAWFVIPVESIYGRKTAKLCLHGDPRSGTLGKYWEAWGLMNWRWPGSQ